MVINGRGLHSRNPVDSLSTLQLSSRSVNTFDVEAVFPSSTLQTEICSSAATLAYLSFRQPSDLRCGP